MPSLRRTSDGEGFSGSRSEAYQYDEDGRNPKIVGNRPMLGTNMLVGSVTAGTYSDRDWWLTTEILEIIEERDDYVKFRTLNSVYEWQV